LNMFDVKGREAQRLPEIAISASGGMSKRKVTLDVPHEHHPQSSVGSLANNIDEKLAMLFAKNKSGEIPLIEEYAVDMDMPMCIAGGFVYEYICSVKDVGMDNVEMLGHCLLFSAQREEMSRMLLIMDKLLGDEGMLYQVLNVRNQSNHDALYRLMATGNMRQFAWLLDIVPDNHPCLWTRSQHRGDTVLMRLLEAGQLMLAKKLLSKIDDKRIRLKLLMNKRLKRIEGGGSAMDIARRKKVEPVIEWLTEKIEEAQQ